MIGEKLDRLNPAIADLTQAIEREVENYPAAQRLRMHPGVGVLTSLAFVLIGIAWCRRARES
jgi:transposase